MADVVESEREFLEWAMDTLHEINVSNYDHDEVCRLNERSVEVILAIRARLSQAGAGGGVAVTANCCHCGRIVDTREKADGGDDFGCQLADGRWTCSPECWDAVTEPTPPAPSGEVLRIALERLRDDCQSTIDLYHRNGPSFTSPGGDEYEPTSFVIEKMEELIAVAEAALAPSPSAGEPQRDDEVMMAIVAGIQSAATIQIDPDLPRHIRAILATPPATPVQPTASVEALRVAFDKARYQPGDPPVVPIKLATFMKEVEAILSNPAPGHGEGGACGA